MITKIVKQAQRAFVYLCLINSITDLNDKVLVVKADQPVHCKSQLNHIAASKVISRPNNHNLNFK